MNPKKQMALIRRLITRYGMSCKDEAFKGSYHPDDWHAVEHEYIASREALENAIMRIIVAKSGTI